MISSEEEAKAKIDAYIADLDARHETAAAMPEGTAAELAAKAKALRETRDAFAAFQRSIVHAHDRHIVPRRMSRQRDDLR